MERVKTAFGILKGSLIPLLAIPFAYSVLEQGMMRLVGRDLSINSISGLFSGGFYSVGAVLILYELVRVIFITGYFGMILVVIDGGDINISSFKLFLTRRKLLNILALEAVVIPILAAGCLLLIVPGIYWFVITIMAYFMVIASEDTGTFEAIARSVEVTGGMRWTIFTYSFLYFLLILIASIQPVLSIIFETFFTPLFYIVLALLYRECVNKHVQ
ncbi:MAG: hypothetical protein V1647_01605 [Pseudomonadota bacterium]